LTGQQDGLNGIVILLNIGSLIQNIIKSVKAE
jgi:hypothetical protein